MARPRQIENSAPPGATSTTRRFHLPSNVSSTIFPSLRYLAHGHDSHKNAGEPFHTAITPRIPSHHHKGGAPPGTTSIAPTLLLALNTSPTAHVSPDHSSPTDHCLTCPGAFRPPSSVTIAVPDAAGHGVGVTALVVVVVPAGMQPAMQWPGAIRDDTMIAPRSGTVLVVFVLPSEALS
jgi:hypothetical protein